MNYGQFHLLSKEQRIRIIRENLNLANNIRSCFIEFVKIHNPADKNLDYIKTKIRTFLNNYNDSVKKHNKIDIHDELSPFKLNIEVIANLLYSMLQGEGMEEIVWDFIETVRIEEYNLHE
jgi:hypothetical protein